ncbi:MAG TPA: hypothetical protein PK798_11050 [Flavobacteriales bacterium]|nr:hypothetical protein [Flavobacteriales bacterium]HRJ36363.1 hypothetical protein [Flavobacteriales bacterium]HRJ39319.1 hypothetical protein [Flavobacteriales bacterium]
MKTTLQEIFGFFVQRNNFPQKIKIAKGRVLKALKTGEILNKNLLIGVLSTICIENDHHNRIHPSQKQLHSQNG